MRPAASWLCAARLPGRGLCAALAAVVVLAGPGQQAASASPTASREGFHKDLFIDGGYDLTDRPTLAAADLLGLSYDSLATEDQDLQTEVMVGSAEDQNGWLLFPDGAPRYALLYTTGGTATSHGRSLGEEGRQRVRDFFARGGSYSGSCAGAFIAMLHNSAPEYEESGPWVYYYHLWPGIGRASGVSAHNHDIVFDDPTHPLVARYPSLADGRVENVRHNYGCRMDPDYFASAPQTEYLGMMESSERALDGYYNIVAYKASLESGRLVITCSHPEGVADGERRDLMAAILDYALDGVGQPRPAKGKLASGVARSMSGDEERVGDGQYHLFELDLPAGARDLVVSLDALSADCDLYLGENRRPDRLAHDQASAHAGSGDERIAVTAPAAGRWLASVHGAHDVLAGASYRISASWRVEEMPPDAGTGEAGGLDGGAAEGGVSDDGGGSGGEDGGAAATDADPGQPGGDGQPPGCACRLDRRPAAGAAAPGWGLGTLLVGAGAMLGLLRRRRWRSGPAGCS